MSQKSSYYNPTYTTAISPMTSGSSILASTTNDVNIIEMVEAAQTAANEAGSAAQESRNRPLKYSTQILDLGDGEYLLKQPIFITIEEYISDDNYVAAFPEFELIGEGDTETEALLDLKHAILDLYDELINTSESELGKLPKMWRRIITKIIEKKNS